MRQSETFQLVLFSRETNDKIATKRPAEPRLSIIRPLSVWQVNIYIRRCSPCLITKDLEPRAHSTTATTASRRTCLVTSAYQRGDHVLVLDLFIRPCQSKLLQLQFDHILNRQISVSQSVSQSISSISSLDLITDYYWRNSVPRKWNITNNGNIKISSRSSSMLLFLADGNLDSIV